jgi:hypothetical protein
MAGNCAPVSEAHAHVAGTVRTAVIGMSTPRSLMLARKSLSSRARKSLSSRASVRYSRRQARCVDRARVGDGRARGGLGDGHVLLLLGCFAGASARLEDPLASRGRPVQTEGSGFEQRFAVRARTARRRRFARDGRGAGSPGSRSRFPLRGAEPTSPTPATALARRTGIPTSRPGVVMKILICLGRSWTSRVAVTVALR